MEARPDILMLAGSHSVTERANADEEPCGFPRGRGPTVLPCFSDEYAIQQRHSRMNTHFQADRRHE